MMTTYDITPVPKPRQTRADVWKQRPAVMRYRAFADEARLLKMEVKNGSSIVFILPMPKSWSEKKKEQMNNEPHLQRPDLDNLLKALLDALMKEDSVIWKLGMLEKRWGDIGLITIS